MHKFEFKIGINEMGEPFLDIPKGKIITLEEKFMSLELSRMILLGVINEYNNKRGNGRKTITEADAKKIVTTFNVISGMADEVGLLYKATKEIEDSLGDIINPKNEE